MLVRAIPPAAKRVSVKSPISDLGRWVLRWGDQLDIRPVLLDPQAEGLSERAGSRATSPSTPPKWLAEKAAILSTCTVRLLRSYLNRSVKRAMARDKVKRNVVDLCAVPKGQEGRPSKALTMAQAEVVLKTAEGTPCSRAARPSWTESSNHDRKG
ncbi:hypothetical protein [Planotetraspora silvatica]|uniref:hypothetical protein n=1 Tax=Planotetraspora silvatica TaxID=234614 RepID=UPI0027E42C35|nr:hypothetical protein [Planotetraspora silvatica]